MPLIKMNKTEARKRYNNGQEIILAGDNVNTFHILGGWALGCRISKEVGPQHLPGESDFDARVRNFEWYLERELGRRAAYYQEQIQGYCTGRCYVTHNSDMQCMERTYNKVDGKYLCLGCAKKAKKTK